MQGRKTQRLIERCAFRGSTLLPLRLYPSISGDTMRRKRLFISPCHVGKRQGLLNHAAQDLIPLPQLIFQPAAQEWFSTGACRKSYSQSGRFSSWIGFPLYDAFGKKTLRHRQLDGLLVSFTAFDKISDL